jgi:hypothetical protein
MDKGQIINKDMKEGDEMVHINFVEEYVHNVEGRN